MPSFDYKARSPLAHPVANLGGKKQVPRHIDVHITGTGAHARAQKHRQPVLKRLLNVFQSQQAFSTFGIDPWGEIWQFGNCDQRQAAQSWGYVNRAGKKIGLGGFKHVKNRLVAGYRNLTHADPLYVPDWWTRYNAPTFMENKSKLINRIPNHGEQEPWSLDLYTPLDYLDDDEWSPNENSISIECIQWQRSYKAWKSGEFINYKLTAAQYVALHNLIVDRCNAWGIVFNPRQVRGHEDVNPWGRGTRKGGWDPGAARSLGDERFCWDCVETLDFTHGGEYDLCPCVIPVPKKKSWE